MPLQATSGAASYDAFGGGVAAVPKYIEDVFSTYLYTGNGSTQTITNGIDLAGEGGLVWTKQRNGTNWHCWNDSARGTTQTLFSNNTNNQSNYTTGLTGFNADGYSIGSLADFNTNAATFASWTFRKQPKFFDVVTFTGGGSNIFNHSLGSVPGCVIIKCTNLSDTWWVVHRGANGYSRLNDTLANSGTGTPGIATTGSWCNCTSTTFDASNFATAGNQFVAYLFAHNAGGFGLTGTDNVISCGSVATNGLSSYDINLGYEPQWLLIKNATSTSNWYLADNMRGLPVGSAGKVLYPNTSGSEGNLNGISLSATGFTFDSSPFGSGTYIYIAIRRGPMKVPTSGTSVFVPYAGSDTSAITSNFPVDFFIDNKRSGNANNSAVGTRLLGGNAALVTSSVASSQTGLFSTTWYQSNTTFQPNCFGTNTAVYGFGRAPNFSDVVCYTGTGSLGNTLSHNLGVTPELMIVKRQNSNGNWTVYTATTGNTAALYLNSTDAVYSGDVNYWNDTSPTSTQFTVGLYSTVNGSGGTYVAYLFATLAGVSKVGSYTGTGATQTISCGFTGGAKFVLIKRTDSNSNWFVWDTARGMVSGTDPSLSLNTTSAESNADWVYTTTGGFQIVTSNTNVNASGGTYIFLAIA